MWYARTLLHTRLRNLLFYQFRNIIRHLGWNKEIGREKFSSELSDRLSEKKNVPTLNQNLRTFANAKGRFCVELTSVTKEWVPRMAMLTLATKERQNSPLSHYGVAVRGIGGNSVPVSVRTSLTGIKLQWVIIRSCILRFFPATTNYLVGD